MVVRQDLHQGTDQQSGWCVIVRLLRFSLNVTWKDKWTNDKLYHGLPKSPKVTDKIKARRLRLAGHCVRHGVKEDADSASVEVAGSLGAYSREKVI